MPECTVVPKQEGRWPGDINFEILTKTTMQSSNRFTKPTGNTTRGESPQLHDTEGEAIP